MSGHAFSLAGATLTALPSGALFWSAENLLCVADLHLGKSDRLARRSGALLPPYENRATLGRLDADLAATSARNVICLGDSFDDLQASESLDEDDRLWLLRLMAGRRWTWILGNHDPGPVDLGGAHLAEAYVRPLHFRHIAEPGATAEISGHYHPKMRLAGRSHRCFLVDTHRLILPAYGAYAGGLWCQDAALTSLLRADALAVLTGTKAIPVPMPR